MQVKGMIYEWAIPVVIGAFLSFALVVAFVKWWDVVLFY